MTQELRWTSEQGFAYETAREVINSYIALVVEQQDRAETLEGASGPLAKTLQFHIEDLTQLRNDLNILDDAAIKATVEKFTAQSRSLAALLETAS